MLWTRVSGYDIAVEVLWQVSLDELFKERVSQGVVVTGPERDFTVKALPNGLKPATRYWFRFLIDGAASPTGRTRTLPSGHVKRLRIAVASCSNYCFGYFNAYDAMAKDPDLHFVLHTGDYLYEYGTNEWGDDQGKLLGRAHQPPHEMVSLADYRTRHAQYKLDVGAQAMHAAHPCLLVWDDHESANNPWTGGAQNHQPQTEGEWLKRRAAALKAWYEWMPVRDPINGEPPENYWRTFVFGDLATLVCLETRHTARAEQIDYSDHRARIIDDSSRDQFLKDVLGAEERPMISSSMEKVIDSSLRQSVAQRQPWRLLGNAIPMGGMSLPDLTSIDFVNNRADDEDIAELLWKSRWNLPWYTDTWDGYPRARERLYQQCAASGARDMVVLTGDSHSFWFNVLADDAGNNMGVELGTSGITSPGDFLDLGFSTAEAGRLDQHIAEGMPEVHWTDNLHNGYLQIEITPENIHASCIALNTICELLFTTAVIKETWITRSEGTFGTLQMQLV